MDPERSRVRFREAEGLGEDGEGGERSPFRLKTNEGSAAGRGGLERCASAPAAPGYEHEPGSPFSAGAGGAPSAAPFSPLPTGREASALPSELSGEHGLPSVSPADLASAMRQPPAGVTVHVVDCRYAYEFAGGHVAGAANCVEPLDLERYLAPLVAAGDGHAHAIVLHCEFSSQRAPRLFRHVRDADRRHHLKDYPALSLPHVYILDGGYKAFAAVHPELCEPHGGYIRMHDPAHADALKQEVSRHKAVWEEARRHGSLRELRF